MDFPWRPTLRDFLDHARSERGVEVKKLESPVFGPRGEVHYDYVELSDPDRVIALSVGCDLDDRLTEPVLRNLCRLFNIPPDDFNLDPDQDD